LGARWGHLAPAGEAEDHPP